MVELDQNIMFGIQMDVEVSDKLNLCLLIVQYNI